MARWQIALLLINILSTSYLGAMQFIEKDSFGESHYLKSCAVFTYENRPYLALAFGVLTGVLSTIIIFLQPYLTRKEFRDSLMDGIFEQVLDNDKNNARITLFRDTGWLVSWWYRFLDFGGLWKRGWKIKDILKYCWMARYICILKRWGTEHRNSNIHFCYNSETAERCQGIAGQVRQREVRVVVSLPNLLNIPADEFVETNAIVQEYMQKGYIADFKVLRSIKRLSPYIYGNIISAKGGSKKIVLVIDSWTRETPFTRKKVDLLSTYVKQISATFGT